MDRRTFIGTCAGGSLAVPLLAKAQQSPKVWRIGYLRRGVVPPHISFWDTMRKFGWVEGQNVKFEPRYAVNPDEFSTLATDLVRSRVDIIFTLSEGASKAAKQATQTTPVVFYIASDPVEVGLVASLARPGGNLTGFTIGLYDEKLLEVLKSALPGLSRVAYPAQNPSPAFLRAAQALGVEVKGIAMLAGAPVPQDFDPFYAAARKAGADAAVIPDRFNFASYLKEIALAAVKNRFPAIAPFRDFPYAGGLLSYGPTQFQGFPRVATLIDKILRGAKPADLPVEQATKFELIVNLKTAKALGLTIPQSVRQRADELIQ